ncbi:MAG: PQQ-dependent sugar dehydrogenase [Anaerolineales bacterium]
MNLNIKKLFVFTFILLTACQPKNSQQEPPNKESTKIVGTATNISTPTTTFTATIPPTIIELDGTLLPEGFSIIKYADLYRPTAFAFDGPGRLYVTSTDGNIYILTDSNKDGRADSQTIFASGFNLPLGIAIHQPTNNVYVSYQSAIMVLHDSNQDDKADTQQVLIDNLPSTGRHQNDNLKFGPDGWLYMGMGSTCDACQETDPRSASILRFNISTGKSEIYATGMRNPYDLAFHPITGDLFATDNGRDDLGLDAPQEELNAIVQGGSYGFPNCWDSQNTTECNNTIPAIAFFEPHSSADWLDFNEMNNLGISKQCIRWHFGSWLKLVYKQELRTRYLLNSQNGKYSGEVSWFAKFPSGTMPLPILFGPDGTLYIGDYINGKIYRISYGLP